jgi:hypothetical protein
MARHTARSAIDPAAPWPRRAGWLPLAVLAIALA